MDHGSLASALHAAAGDDPVLVHELQQALISSAARQIDLMSRSRCDANWEYSCLRLKGLAASFGVVDLLELADEAGVGAPGDPVILRKLKQSLQSIKDSALG